VDDVERRRGPYRLVSGHRIADALACDDVASLTADDIRRSRVEPRLMTKLDFRWDAVRLLDDLPLDAKSRHKEGT
jgi:hypothetical protein